MKIDGQIRRTAGMRLLENDRGIVLIAVLCLIAALVLVGTTAYIVSSTDVKIGGNFRTNQTALQVAMAGTEQARQTLRAANASSSNPASFSEELVAYASTPLASSSTFVSGYAYSASLTNDSAAGETSTTDINGKAVITSIATGPNNAKSVVITTVQLYSFSNNSPAVLYSKDNTTLNGSSININGNDAGNCGGSNLGGVYVYSDPPNNTHTYNPNGGPTVTGNPATSVGNTNLDLQSYIDSLKGAATITLTEDNAAGNGTNSYGSASSYVTVYSDATLQNDGELMLNNATGYGILLVKGNLKLAGNINWHGIIIATGVVTTSGGGSDSKNIQGQIFSGASALGDTQVNGGVTIGYNSCEVKKASSSQPLKVVNWKQSY
jgi:hypothetical protein